VSRGEALEQQREPVVALVEEGHGGAGGAPEGEGVALGGQLDVVGVAAGVQLEHHGRPCRGAAQVRDTTPPSSGWMPSGPHATVDAASRFSMSAVRAAGSVAGQ
jgi:hypothetical protein